MEGFFRAKEYAILENISYDAAMHRVNRNQVRYFKEPESGNIYIYWTDSVPLVPEGYISIQKFAKQRGYTVCHIHGLVKNERFKKEDVFKRKVGIKNETYIRKDAEIISHYIPLIIEKNRPEGCLSVKEWCKKNGITNDNARQYILKRRLNCIRHMGHLYIPEDEQKPEPLKRGGSYALSKTTPEGFLPIRKWCKKYNEKYWPIYRECSLGRFPCLRIQRYSKYYIFIKDMPKEEIINDYEVGVG